MTILLLEDKRGISGGYENTWASMLLAQGIRPDRVIHRSVWKSPVAATTKLLIQKGNRKTPGFNEDHDAQRRIHHWLMSEINRYKPEIIVCMDAALLGQVEAGWDWATIENMRGGLYDYFGYPFYVMTPITAVNTRKSTKDIAMMNQGVYSKEEWDERKEDSVSGGSDSESDDDPNSDIYVEPYSISLGKWIVAGDLRKLRWIMDRNSRDGFKEFRPALRVVMGRDDALAARDWLLASTLISSDIETDPKAGLITVVGYTGLHKDGTKRTWVFPLYAGKSYTTGTPLDLDIYISVITEVNASGIPFVFQNGPYDLFWFAFYDWPVKNYAHDTMTLFWSMFPELPKRLDFISSMLLPDYRYWKGARKTDDAMKYWIYNGLDCDRTLDDACYMIDSLVKDNDSKPIANYYHAHMRVVAFIGMSLRGVKADGNRREYHAGILEATAYARLEYLRYIIADDSFNPNSSQQKFDLLYRKLGIKLRTEKGKFTNRPDLASTGAVPLRSMRGEHPLFGIVVQAIMDAMEPAKQISNVINMSRADWGSGNVRYHTNYNGVATTTTRAGSNKAPIDIGGNLQNLRKTYRDVIAADDFCFFLDIDFSAADDVFVSFESGDPRKIELFRKSLDSHAANATLFFPNWTYDQVVAGKKADDPKVVHPITGIRQITKKLSHGCNYLMAGNTLLQTAGREAIVAAAKESGYVDAGIWANAKLVSFCEHLEGLYRNHYTRFRRTGSTSWYSELHEEFVATGGFLTAFGYYQRFLGDKADESVLRAIAATAGQANTAGRINAVVEELILGYIPPSFRDAPNPDAGDRPRRITPQDHGISLHLQNHDSLTFQIRYNHPNWREGVRDIYRVMGRPVVIRNKLTGGMEEFRVGLESEVGIRWGKGLHGFKGNSVEAVELGLTLFSEEERLILQNGWNNTPPVTQT